MSTTNGISRIENGRAATSKSMYAFLQRPLVASQESGLSKTVRVALCHVGPDPVWMQFGREPKGSLSAGHTEHRLTSDRLFVHGVGVLEVVDA